MRRRVKIILVKIMNLSLALLIVVFLVINRAKLVKIEGSSIGHLPTFNKSLDYNLWEGNLDFMPLPNPYKIITKEDYIVTEYISFSDVVSQVGKGANFNENNANNIKNNMIIRLDNAREFREFSELANSSNIKEKLFYLSANYCLGKDINFADFPGSRIYPIGNNEYPFIGSFDGQGFELQNFILEDEERILQLYNIGLSIPNLELFPQISHYALFANVGESGKISKVGIINPILQINYPRPQPPLYPVNMQYAASLVGINNGLVEYVYCIDNRDYYNAGWDVRGGFMVSGIMAENNGIFRHAYLSAKTVVYSTAKSSAYFKPVLYINNGLVEEVFFDRDVFEDPVINVNNIVAKTTNELILQENCLSGTLWKSYDLTKYDPNIDLSYPKLVGILEGNGLIEDPYLISTPIDLIFFSKMIDLSDVFRDKYYQITNCIDMRQVSKTAYIPPVSGFSGTLDGEISSTDCGFHHPHDGENHAIINLELSYGRSHQGKYYVGLFSQLLGTVKNLNFINCKIHNLHDTNKYRGNIFNIGILAGFASDSRIINVHSNSTIDLNNANKKLGLTNVGGLVGFGDCSIINSSNSGNIIGGVHDYLNDSQFIFYNQTMGGLLGSSNVGNTKIINSTNSGIIEGFSYYNYNFNDPIRKPTLIGGVVGNILSSEFINVSNSGLVRSSSSVGNNNIIYLGGVFGKYSYHTGGYITRHSLKNTGDFILNSSTRQIKAAGIGIINYQSDDSDNLVFLGLINEGQIIEEKQNSFNYDFAGVIYDIGSNATIYGAVNRADINLEINNTKKVNPLYFSENNESNFNAQILNSSNYGNINVTINTVITGDIFISGLTCSEYISLKNCFNYGNITLKDIKTSNSLNISIAGLVSKINYSRTVQDSHNQGNIKFIATSGNHNLNIGGITTLNNVTSNLPKDQFGIIQNVTNNGLIEVKTLTQGTIMAAGIATDNKGLIKDAANLNDIAVANELQNTEAKTIIGGIASINSNEVSQIIDTINYGNLYGKTNKYAFVGGILGEAVDRLSVVRYAINYGDVFSFGALGRNAPIGGSFYNGTYILNPVPHARSGGVIASGLSSFSNVINKGTVASNDTAGGVFGFIITSEVTTDGIEMTDSINYGKIKTLTSLSMNIIAENYLDRYKPTTGTISETDTVQIRGLILSRSVNVKTPYGGFIGYIWQQNNNRSANKIKFRYLLNVDAERNFAGRGAIFIDFLDFLGGQVTYITEGNADISTIASTKVADASDPPFTNLRTYSLDDNNDLKIRSNVLTQLGENKFAFDLRIINVDDNGHVIDQPIQRSQSEVNVNIINSNTTPYSKYKTYNFLKDSLEDLTFKLKLYNNNILDVRDVNNNSIALQNYSKTLDSITFNNNYVQTLPMGVSTFRVYYNSNSYITIEINKLDSDAFDNTFLNLRANNYTYNRAENEPFLDILIDLNYNKKAVLSSIINTSTNTTITSANYQFIGIYSENFFMRKDSIFRLDAEGNRVYLLHDYIFYLTKDELPPQHQNNNTYGAYVISTSEGRTNGALFPANIDLEKIDQTINNSKDSYWRESPSSGRNETISQKFINMQQIGKNKQTTIFNMQLESINNSDVVLSNPYIDNQLGEIIYYVSNDTPIAKTYKVSHDSYHIAFGAKIYSKYFGENDSRNQDITEARFSPQSDNSDFFGTIVVVAEDNTISKEYLVRVITINPIELSNPQVNVNENRVTEFSYNGQFLNIFDTRSVHFKNGSLEIDFRVSNLPNGYDILDNIQLYDQDIRGLDPADYHGLIDSDYYTISGGIVKADLFAKDTPNPYWIGNVSFKLTLKQTLHSGRFYIALSYYSKIYIISFNKEISTENFVYDFSHDTSNGIVTITNFPTGTNNGYMYSQVDFGKLLEFTSGPLLNNNLPTYLSSINISPFSKITEVSLSSYRKVGNYYVYTVHLRIVAENESSRLWIHEISEKEVNPNAYRYLKDGNPTNDTLLEREDKNVTLQVFYNIDNIYGSYDFFVYQSPIQRRLAGKVNFEIDGDYQDYLSINIDDSLRFRFNENTLPGEYKISFKYSRSDIITVNGTSHVITWDFLFNDIIIVKNQSKNSYLNNITFTGGNERTRFPEIICSSHNHENNNTLVIQGAIIYGDEIIFEGEGRCNEFNIVGYVSNVNLSYYSPLFDLPIGSSIYRLSHIDSKGNEIWTNDLFANFTVSVPSIGHHEEMQYIAYKVVSEDGQFETKYNIQVIDITFNIRFMYNIIFVDGNSYEPKQIPEDLLNKIIYITFSNLETEHDEDNNIIDIFGVENRMTSIHIITENLTIRNYPFNFNKSGYYTIQVDLPDNYQYEIEVQDKGFLEDFGLGYEGKKMFAEPTTTIRTYQFNIYIKSSSEKKPWGVRTVWEFCKKIFS